MEEKVRTRMNNWACILLDMLIAYDEHTAQRGVLEVRLFKAP
jgi:hypothetical protein